MELHCGKRFTAGKCLGGDRFRIPLAMQFLSELIACERLAVAQQFQQRIIQVLFRSGMGVLELLHIRE